jgi:hypothetical protein
VLSREAFVEQLIQALRAAGETRAIRYEADTSCVFIGDNREFPDVVVGLDVALRQFEKFPPDRRATEVHRFAELCREPRIPDDYQVAERHLQLSLRHISYLHLHEEFAAAWPSQIARRSLVHSKITDDLILCVGLIDGPALQLLTHEQTDRWEVSADQVLRSATKNQSRSAFRLKRSGSVYRSLSDDFHAAANFVFGQHLSELPTRGSPVVLLPTRDCLVVTGSEEIEGLVQMAAIGHVEIEESEFPVSGRPLTWDGRAWRQFEPPEKVRATFTHLEQAYEVARYAAQSAALRMRYRNAGDRTGIAEVRLLPDGLAFKKVALWRSGGAVLLPAADEVALHNPESGTFHVARWNDMQRVLGDHLVPMHMPLRYRAERFPTPAEIEAMSPTTVEEARPQPGTRAQVLRPVPMGFTKR